MAVERTLRYCAGNSRHARGRENYGYEVFDIGQHDALVEDVATALAASGLQPGRPCLEITETTLMLDMEHTVGMLRRLRAPACRWRSTISAPVMQGWLFVKAFDQASTCHLMRAACS